MRAVAAGIEHGIELTAAEGDDLHASVSEVLKQPQVAAQFKAMSQVVHHESREFFANKTRADHQRYGTIVKQFKITAD